jgi:hypothetical protein
MKSARHSGAMQAGVPTSSFGLPNGISPPKSMSLARPSLVSRTLPGLMSR